MLDYIYCVDLMAYCDNPEKSLILSGKESRRAYKIHPGESRILSLQAQRNCINDFDTENFLALFISGGNFREFSKYVIDSEKRQLIQQFINNHSPNEEIPHKK